MKRKNAVLALAPLVGLLAGCTDLTERPVTRVDANYFQSVAGANAATIGTYAFLREIYGGEGEILMTMVGTDSWEKGEQLTANGLWNDYNAQMAATLGNVGGVDALQGRWSALYR